MADARWLLEQCQQVASTQPAEGQAEQVSLPAPGMTAMTDKIRGALNRFRPVKVMFVSKVSEDTNHHIFISPEEFDKWLEGTSSIVKVERNVADFKIDPVFDFAEKGLVAIIVQVGIHPNFFVITLDEDFSTLKSVTKVLDKYEKRQEEDWGEEVIQPN
jgi:hypothetical protein